MQKMQILFPEPLLRKIRGLAEKEDRPVSEVIRRAVEKFLEMRPAKGSVDHPLPTFHGGKFLVSAGELKDRLYNDEPV